MKTKTYRRALLALFTAIVIGAGVAALRLEHTFPKITHPIPLHAGEDGAETVTSNPK